MFLLMPCEIHCVVADGETVVHVLALGQTEIIAAKQQSRAMAEEARTFGLVAKTAVVTGFWVDDKGQA